jgi:hypothetical protein
MSSEASYNEVIDSVLLEQLAEKVHAAWMARRISEGWKLGERRDDAAKTHPCLEPYDQLPDSEKEYDRATAAETIRMIQELGYDLIPGKGEAGA